ncbi:MAG TPA: major capsid protein [Nitrospira sp.]|mgnify:CR=1 FL=1|nr:major capsid protein [Nitrospira sp.]
MKITEITTETDITRDDLLAAITEGESDLATLLEVENPTAEQIAEMTALNTAIDGGVARVGEMDAAVQAQADELQALRDARDARQAAAEAAEAETEVEPQQPETDVVVEPEPVAEVVETAPVVEVAAPEAQAIAASSARANLAGRRPAPSPERTQKEPVVSRTPVLVASADNGLVAAGAPVTMKTFQEIAREKLQSARGAQARVTSKVGTFRIQADEDITVHEKSTADQMNDAIERAVSMDRVREKQPALTASAGSDAEALTAAGWCAPSETVYDLCEGGSREGLFELPEIQIDRGGINFTQGLDFSPLYSDATFGWDITEAEMDAGTFDKPCVSVPCPTFEEERLDAIGFCVTSDLLPKAAYPELEQAFIAEALIAFDHKKSRKRFAAAIATAGAAIAAGTLGSVAASTLAAVELVVEGERRKYRWPSTAVMEAVVPHWLRLAFRADLSNRTGVSEFELSDADIARWFSIRGIRIQYIYDYTGYLLAPGVATMPTTAQVFVFKAGTYVEGAAPVISLSTVYDSVLLAENKNMALFFEQGVLLLKRCYGGRLINIPVCAAGRTGIANVACA